MPPLFPLAAGAASHGAEMPAHFDLPPRRDAKTMCFPDDTNHCHADLLLFKKNANNPRSDHQSLAGQAPVAHARGDALGGHWQQE